MLARDRLLRLLELVRAGLELTICALKLISQQVYLERVFPLPVLQLFILHTELRVALEKALGLLSLLLEVVLELFYLCFKDHLVGLLALEALLHVDND